MAVAGNNRQPPERGARKFPRLPIAVDRSAPRLSKPDWLRVRARTHDEASRRVTQILSENRLSTICREAACPNIGECFSHGTAAFLIMGSVCTRRCPFCDVAHGRPEPLDAQEPLRLANAVRAMELSHVVITSVDRDDLLDGGAGHYAAVIAALRAAVAGISVEILVPDFRGRLQKALDILGREPPDVFNHNLETVPSLYRSARPGADYRNSLAVLSGFKSLHPDVPTKSGLMLGLGETDDEVTAVLSDLLEAGTDIVTIGQYLAPSSAHLPVRRYVHPEEFERWREKAVAMGFKTAFTGVFVRSSYHAGEVARSTSHGAK